MNEQISRNPKSLGEALRRRRRQLGLTQAELGAKAGIRQATISDLETGETGARLETVFDLLAALELEVVVRERSKGSVQTIEDIF